MVRLSRPQKVSKYLKKADPGWGKTALLGEFTPLGEFKEKIIRHKVVFEIVGRIISVN